MFPQLEKVRQSLKLGELCLVNRLNQHLFSTLNEEDNDLDFLVNFKGSAGYLTIGPQRVCLWLDGRYWESHKSDYRDSGVECLPSLGEQALRQYLKQGYLENEGIRLCKVYVNLYKWSALDFERFRRVVPKVEWKQREFMFDSKALKGSRNLDFFSNQVTGESVAKRTKRLQRHIKDQRVHFICNPDNISWLLNIRADDFPYKRSVKGIVLVAKHYAAFFSNLDSRTIKLLRVHAQDWLVISEERLWRKALEKLMGEHLNLKLEIEFHRRPGCINQADYDYLNQMLSSRRLVRRKRSLVELGRIDKNESEILEMKKSGHCLSILMQESIAWIKQSVTAGERCDEQSVKNFIIKKAKKLGAKRACFPPIVASGVNSTSPHHMHGNRELKIGDVVILDLGFYFENSAYATDMTRCFVIGDQVSAMQRQVYTELLRAFLLQWSIRFKHKNLSARDLDQIGRDSLANIEHRGFTFCHSTGHGVGIVDHELALSISIKSKMMLRPNYTYSIEPGCYANENVKGERFGMRLEDVVVTSQSDDGIRHVSLAPCPFEENLIDRKLWKKEDQANYQDYLNSLNTIEFSARFKANSANL